MTLEQQIEFLSERLAWLRLVESATRDAFVAAVRAGDREAALQLVAQFHHARLRIEGFPPSKVLDAAVAASAEQVVSQVFSGSDRHAFV